MTDQIFCDGGVIQVNPSPLGGTWAFVHVVDGVRRHEASGTVTPADVGLTHVTNNLTELLAVVLALEYLPRGWTGELFSDSGVTLARFRNRRAKMNGIPVELQCRLRTNQERLGAIATTLLGGHPTRLELLRGQRSDGTPVSVYNMRCDDLCKQRAAEFLQKLRC